MIIHQTNHGLRRNHEELPNQNRIFLSKEDTHTTSSRAGENQNENEPENWSTTELWAHEASDQRAAGPSSRCPFKKAAGDAHQNDTAQHVLSDRTKRLEPAISDSTSKSERGANHPMLRDAIIHWPLRLQINARVVRKAAANPRGHNTVSGGESSCPLRAYIRTASSSCASTPAADTTQPPTTNPAQAAGPALTPDALAALKALMKGKLLDGKPALRAKYFPSRFYAAGAYDPEEPEKGLFRSPSLLRVLRHIWMAPSSAMDGADTLRKTCNARAHGQCFVKGRMVGYACAQGRTLISASDWTSKEGSYNYEKMFDEVVHLFEDDPTDPWVVETLKWFQEYAPSTSRSVVTDNILSAASLAPSKVQAVTAMSPTPTPTSRISAHVAPLAAPQRLLSLIEAVLFLLSLVSLPSSHPLSNSTCNALFSENCFWVQKALKGL
ncbi:hypothetical protein FB451DRAFT_1180780 [Mycena latifolia]|nr:hypothetical protein FB451DRAFT_1180780 [Mycena latifolia]